MLKKDVLDGRFFSPPRFNSEVPSMDTGQDVTLGIAADGYLRLGRNHMTVLEVTKQMARFILHFNIFLVFQCISLFYMCLFE